MFKKLQILKYFIITKQYFNRQELEKFQKKKIKKLIESLNCKFYPKAKTLEDFPIVNKKIFMKNFDNINTLNIKLQEALDIATKAEKTRNFSPKINKVTVGLSSGTSGSRGIFLISEKESCMWAGYILKRMLPKPFLQKHKIAFFLRSNSNLYESVNSNAIAFSFFDLSFPFNEHIEKLNKYNPSILIAPAQVLKLLAINKNLYITPSKIISVAEVLEEDDRRTVELKFSQKVHQIYQCTEGLLAHTCKFGNLHLNEDIIYFEKEWIDKKTGRFYPIITDLNRTTQAIIRYKLDDILILDKSGDECPCGSAFTRIEKIEGRHDDILSMQTLDDKKYLLFPDFIRHAIISLNILIHEYSVIKRENTLHIYLDPLEIKNEINTALLSLYKRHNLKPLEHIFSGYKYQKLNQKRRRVKEI